MENIIKTFKSFIKTFKLFIKTFKFLIKKTLLKNPIKTNNTFNKIKFKFKFLIKKTLLKHPNKTNNIFNKIKFKFKFKTKVSDFNIYLISLISLLFIYLFYLTIPALYDKTWVQNTIERKLLNEFKINFSISSEITYEILPSPHFTIKNTKILNDDLNNPKEIAEIKKLKVFIFKSNFFKKEKLEIKKVLIKDANFLIQPADFNFFSRFFDNKFSKKKIRVKNSNIFFKDKTDEMVSITQISKSFLFYDDLNLENQFFLEGEIFKIPFIFTLNKDVVNKKSNILINSKKYKIKINNQTVEEKNTINGLNNLSILNYKLITEYNFKDKLLLFKSLNPKLSNSLLSYNGTLKFNPFSLILDANYDKINLKKLFKNSFLFLELIKSGQLFHDNLNVGISINSSDTSNISILNKIKLNFNAINGQINFDNSYVSSNKIGLLKVKKSKLILYNNNLLFNGDFNLDIKNYNSFYSFFQTPKKFRKPIKNISFNLEFNFFSNRLKIGNFKIGDIEAVDGVVDILTDFNLDDDQQVGNLIIFKNLVNNIFSAYDG